MAVHLDDLAQSKRALISEDQQRIGGMQIHPLFNSSYSYKIASRN